MVAVHEDVLGLELGIQVQGALELRRGAIPAGMEQRRVGEGIWLQRTLLQVVVVSRARSRGPWSPAARLHISKYNAHATYIRTSLKHACAVVVCASVGGGVPADMQTTITIPSGHIDCKYAKLCQTMSQDCDFSVWAA